MNFIISIFFGAFAASIILTILVRRLALWLKIVDQPQVGTRHIHQRPVALLGGLAIFLAFVLLLIWVYFSPIWPVKKFSLLEPLSSNLHMINLKQIIGILLAGLLLMIGGWLDDKHHRRPLKQIIWPILACLIIISCGIGINYINNPFGAGYLYLNHWKIEILRFNGTPFYFTPLADLFTFIWLMILMYSTKLLDGLDGLVSGVGVIGGLAILFLSLSAAFFQPDVATLAAIFVGASAGFLIFNFYPAKIFLGEGGSLFIGFMLGVLGIISGAKIATTILVLGLPILDLLWVIGYRIFKEKKSPFSGDNRHLHFRLLAAGFSHRGAVIFLWLVSLIFGFIALFLRTSGKVLTLGTLIIFVVLLGIFINFKKRFVKQNV
jgi:UDP-GlcNAc:undecaprenyl-phosphate GlcNAc-1-phosphate transferase